MKNEIAVLRPRLPTADQLVPYLREMDETRVYSNFGSLCRRLAAQLEVKFGLAASSVIPTNSGTSGLCGALLAVAAERDPRRTLALLPSLTFVATAIAAERCGLRPFVEDVDADTWMLDADRLLGHPRLDEVAVVIPVAPYGRAVRQAPWHRFSAITGIPVVIDAAASFATIETDPAPYLGAIPTVLSFHATKSFGIGEGGCVISDHRATSEAIACTLNFGFLGIRDSVMASLNGKMSELHAAVGLAALDGWQSRRLSLTRVALAYAAAWSGFGGRCRLHASPDIDPSYILLECESGEFARAVAAALAADGIATRFWYGGGLVGHTHFAGCRAGPTRVSDDLCARLVGLPCHDDLREEDILRIRDHVRSAIPRCAEVA